MTNNSLSLILLHVFCTFPILSMEQQPHKKQKLQPTIGAYFKITKPHQKSPFVTLPKDLLLHISSFSNQTENGYVRSTCQEIRSLADEKRALTFSTTAKKLRRKIKSLKRNNFFKKNPLEIKLAFNPQNIFLLHNCIKNLNTYGRKQ